jgi:hypothetical protein
VTSALLLRCEIQPDLIGVGSGALLGLHEVSALRKTYDQCFFLDVITAFWLKSAQRHGMSPAHLILRLVLEDLAEPVRR